MLHLRITVPEMHTDAVLDLLQASVGVANLALLRGASITPVGDLVLADVARESADRLLCGLTDLGIDRVGTITLDAIDTAVSRAAEEAERAAPGDGSDAVVWEQVLRTSYADSTLSATFVAFLVIATVLAGIAIILDSAVLVVGAMVLGPEFGALAGLAVGLVHRRATLVRRAVGSLMLGFAAAIAITTVLALVARGLGWIDGSLATADRPQTGFIVSPDKWSLIVALIAGTAGVLSLTSSKSGALVGVFISVTTVPAAANLALAMALGDLRSMLEAGIQLGVNATAIVVAAVLTMLVQKAVWRRVPTTRPRARDARPHVRATGH